MSKKDVLIKMLNDVLNNKVNIKKNNEKALFILKILNKLKKWVQKSTVISLI